MPHRSEKEDKYTGKTFDHTLHASLWTGKVEWKIKRWKGGCGLLLIMCAYTSFREGQLTKMLNSLPNILCIFSAHFPACRSIYQLWVKRDQRYAARSDLCHRTINTNTCLSFCPNHSPFPLSLQLSSEQAFKSLGLCPLIGWPLCMIKQPFSSGPPWESKKERESQTTNVTELNRTGFLHPHDERLLGKKMEETEMQDEKPRVNFNLKCISELSHAC